MLLDAGYNLFYLAANAHLGAKQLLGLGNFFAGNDFPYLELHFHKVLIGNFCLCLYVDHRLCVLRSCASGLCVVFACVRCVIVLCGRMHFLHFGDYIFDFHALKKDFWLVCDLCPADIMAELIQLVIRHFGGIELCEDVAGGLWHKAL